MRFTGRGATPAARQADAIRQAHDEGHRRTALAAYSIGLEVEKLNDIYDELTRHGTNPAFDAAQGEIMAKQRFEVRLPGPCGAATPCPSLPDL